MSDDDDKPSDGRSDAADGREQRFETLRDRLQKIEERALKKQRASRLKSVGDKCSFCGRGKSEVAKLLQAESGATICNLCIREYVGKPDDS